MKVPMHWLREFVDTGHPARELAHRLTMAGLEAEKILRSGKWADKVFVGHVNDVKRHPDADRLVLATVSAGEHRLTVVTGAPNIAAGQKVVLALAGARLMTAIPKPNTGVQDTQTGHDSRRPIGRHGLLREGTWAVGRARGHHGPRS